MERDEKLSDRVILFTGAGDLAVTSARVLLGQGATVALTDVADVADGSNCHPCGGGGRAERSASDRSAR